MEKTGRGKKVILTVLAAAVLVVAVCGGYELWLYEHPDIEIRFSHDRSKDFYRSYPICSFRGRSHLGQGYNKRFDEQLRQFWLATNEVNVWIADSFDFDKPFSVTSDIEIGDGKTVISYRGSGVLRENGESVEINRDCVLDFEMYVKVQRPEETAE